MAKFARQHEEIERLHAQLVPDHDGY